jgi:uncharacterized membrane protein YhaH (DUF805 family)
MPPWRIAFDPRGRIGRATFWRYAVLGIGGVELLLQALFEIAQVRPTLASALINALLAWPVIAIHAKRWHDRDRSGWWVAWLLVPAIGIVYTLVAAGLRRGTPGPNRFGPAPGQ